MLNPAGNKISLLLCIKDLNSGIESCLVQKYRTYFDCNLQEEPVNCATAATVLRAGVENTSYSPGRPLSRAISDPKKMRLQYSGLTPAEAAASDLGINLPPRQSFVDWQASV